MHKPRTSRIVGIGVAASALTLALYYAYGWHRTAVEKELQLQRQQEQQDAVSLVILKEIARWPELGLKAEAICIGTSNDGQFNLTENIDPDPALLRKLKTSNSKIQPYSYCNSAPRNMPVAIYVESFSWKSEEQATITINFTPSLDLWGQVPHMDYELQLTDGRWRITGIQPGPMV